MSYQKYALAHVDIGGGLQATTVWVGDGPIVLVRTVDGRDGERQSRLDIEKQMFIDPLPGQRSLEGISALVNSVAQVAQHRPGLGRLGR